MNVANPTWHRVPSLRGWLAAGLIAAVGATVAASAPRTYTNSSPAAQNAEARSADEGWTLFTPSADSRIIYVSSSDGDDATGVAYSLAQTSGQAVVGDDPHMPQGDIKPFRTIQGAMQSLRDGYPDWLLFKRGDVWEHENIDRWRNGGRSESEKMVVGTYGDWSLDRPKILTGDERGMIMGRDDEVRHVAITGLHMEPHTRGPDDNPTGIACNSQYAEDVLFEDLYIAGYKDNITVQSRGDQPARDITVRRSVIADSWSTTDHSQGIFAKNVHGLTIDECVFDHNGHHASIAGAEATSFNHNMYLSTTNKDVVVRNTVTARASGTGCQARTAGEVVDNIFVANPHGLNFGHSRGVDFPDEYGNIGEASRNIIFGGLPREGIPGNNAMLIGNLGERRMVNVKENFIIGQEGTLHGIVVDGTNYYGIHGLTIKDNMICDFDRLIQVRGEVGEQLTDIRIVRNILQQFRPTCDKELTQFRDATPNSEVRVAANTYFSERSPHRWFKVPVEGELSLDQWASRVNEFRASNRRISFVDPGRTLASYHATLGGEESLEAILDELRQQRRGAWRTELSTQAIATYVREGYEVGDGGSGRVPFLRRGGRNSR